MVGATGAIVLAGDGEAVAWCSTEGERLRLRGAYAGVLLQSCKKPVASISGQERRRYCLTTSTFILTSTPVKVTGRPFTVAGRNVECASDSIADSVI